MLNYSEYKKLAVTSRDEIFMALNHNTSSVLTDTLQRPESCLCFAVFGRYSSMQCHRL